MAQNLEEFESKIVADQGVESITAATKTADDIFELLEENGEVVWWLNRWIENIMEAQTMGTFEGFIKELDE